MVLFGILGELGSGKTLSLTHLGWKHWFERRETIYSNYHLYKIPYVYIDGFDKLDKIKNGFLTMDELWLIADCVTHQSQIYTTSGSFPIESIMPNNPILSVNLNTLDIQPTDVTVQMKRKVKNNETLKEISTKNKKITTSFNHKFFVFNGLDIIEKKASELKPKDYVITIEKIPNDNKDKINSNIAQILGYLFADGTIYYTLKKIGNNKRKGQLKMDSIDKNLLETYAKMFKKLGLKPYINKQKDYYRLTLTNRKFVESIIKKYKNDKNIYMNKWGLRYKDIPETIIKSGNKTLAKFLRGFFDARASVYYNEEKSNFHINKKSMQTKIQITMTNHLNIDNLKTMLLRFGINSTIGKHKNNEIYRLTIKDRASILKYNEFIGFGLRKKQKTLKKMVNYINSRKNKTNLYEVLPMQKLFKNIIEKSGHSITKFNHIVYDRCGVSWFNKYLKYNIGKKNLELVVDFLNKNYPNFIETKTINKIVNSNLKIEPIKKIRDVRPKCLYLYDMSVPLNSNYIANGFLVHNSRTSRATKNRITSNILAKSRKRNLTISFTAQVLNSIDSRIRQIIDFTSYPIMNPQETILKLAIFRGSKANNNCYMKTLYFKTPFFYTCYDTTEEIMMKEESDTPMKYCWQLDKDSEPIFFNTWEEADAYAEKWYVDNQKELKQML